jgi:hypothetical protein
MGDVPTGRRRGNLSLGEYRAPKDDAAMPLRNASNAIIDYSIERLARQHTSGNK